MKAQVGIWLVVCLTAQTLAQTAPGDLRVDELSALRQEIEQHRVAARRLASDEKGAMARLAEIEQEMSLLADLLRGLNRRQVVLDESARALEAELADAEELIVTRRAQLAYHIKMLHRQKRRGELSQVLGAKSVGHLAARVRAWTHVARMEKSMIESVRRAQTVRARTRAELESGMAEVELTRSEATTRKSELQTLQLQRDDEVSRIRRQRTEHERALAEKERSARELQQLITRLEELRETDPEAPVASSFESFRGALPWPVQGEVTRGFGRNIHPRFKTVTEHTGISIAATIGTPVRVIADGSVQYVNWLPGYGKCVIVNHGNGYYTFYAHTSAVYPVEGDLVKANDVIAEVGDTGSLEGAQLYFEVREGRRPVDPEEWLARSAR